MGRPAMVQLLLKGGATVDPLAKDTLRTPLNGAAVQGNLEVVQRLLDARANVETKDHAGQSVLYSSVVGGFLEVVEAVLAHKADVHSITRDGSTCLHEAAYQDSHDVAKVLIDAAVKTGRLTEFLAHKKKTKRGEHTAFELAHQHKSKNIKDLIREAEAAEPLPNKQK